MGGWVKNGLLLQINIIDIHTHSRIFQQFSNEVMNVQKHGTLLYGTIQQILC